MSFKDLTTRKSLFKAKKSVHNFYPLMNLSSFCNRQKSMYKEIRPQIKSDPTLQTVKLSFLYLLGGFKVLFQKIMTLNVICVVKYLQMKMSWQNMNQVRITLWTLFKDAPGKTLYKMFCHHGTAGVQSGSARWCQDLFLAPLSL